MGNAEEKSLIHKKYYFLLILKLFFTVLLIEPLLIINYVIYTYMMYNTCYIADI